MPCVEEQIKITDSKGFVYTVVIMHRAHLGFSTAYYNENIIAQREYGKLHEPLSDIEREWERFSELYSEWSDAATADLSLMCKSYFDNLLKHPQG